MTVVFLIGFVVCIGFCGLALDVARMELTRIQMQNAADAAAVGAELEFERNTYVEQDGVWGTLETIGFTPGGTNTWLAAARADAALNGFTDGANNTTVTVAQGPTSGPYAGEQDALQATITRQIRTIFMGGGTYTLTAQAVSLIPPCLYEMNAANLDYSFTLTQTNISAYCPIYVNKGLNIDQSSWLYATAINVVGDIGNNIDNGRTTPSPTYDRPLLTDPLAAVPQPPLTDCLTGHTATLVARGGGTLLPVNLTPGTYCGGFDFSEVYVTFAPGLYIITGGMNWNDSLAQGNGVTLFFTQGHGYGYGTVTIQGNSSIFLSAPTTGDQAGILFFLDRNWPATQTPGLVCNDAFFIGSGIWYSINSGFSFTSCSNTGNQYYTQVTNQLDYNLTVFTDNYGLAASSNFSNLPWGNPFRTQSVLVQ